MGLAFSSKRTVKNTKVSLHKSPHVIIGRLVKNPIVNIGSVQVSKNVIVNIGTVNKNVNNKTKSMVTSQGKKYDVKTGILLIINQREFYNDDNEIKATNLEERRGTNKDKMKLRQTFTVRGYEIVERENLTDSEIVLVIEEVVDKCETVDSLIVCIMSHGKEGVIFGSNTVMVPLQTIKDLIGSSKYLRNKPKVLIVQACQGTNRLTTEATTVKRAVGYDDSYSSIGNESVDWCKIEPIEMYADFCVANATIRGFVAIRDSVFGSWFIQTLCKRIEKDGDRKHFVDIMTDVIEDMKKRSCKLGCELAVQESTLGKRFYLPPANAIHGINNWI